MTQDVCLAVLAGGAGSRMGYPKAEVRLGGRPVLRVLLDRFQWPGPTLLVTATGRERPPGWDLFGREVVDPVPDQGPLRGTLTALENSPSPIVVVTAVDMPRVGPNQMEWVVRELKTRPNTVGVIARDSAGRVQPFPSAFRVEAATLVRQLLAANRRALHGLLDHPLFAAVDAPAAWGADVWTNLNSPEDLAALDG